MAEQLENMRVSRLMSTAVFSLFLKQGLPNLLEE